MSVRSPEAKIFNFIHDLGNRGIGSEYRAQTDKWVFVTDNILDPLDLPCREALVCYAEEILEVVA